MKVTVDDSLCCAYGNCVMICPEVFDLPDGALTVQIVAAEVPAKSLETAREAVRDCPTGALFSND
jgi:ferredoxin